MENLKGDTDRYKYRTAAEGKAIQVEVYYSVGGSNCFSGGNDPRGIHVSIMPVEINDGRMSCVIGQGKRACVVHMARKNDKTITRFFDNLRTPLEATAARLDKHVPEAARLYEAGDVAGAFELLRSAVKVAPVTAAVTAPAPVADPTPVAVPANSFKVELQVSGEGDKWHGNGIAFPTEAEAKAAGYAKLCAWTMAKDYRVVESTDAPNYNWIDGGMKAVTNG